MATIAEEMGMGTAPPQQQTMAAVPQQQPQAAPVEEEIDDGPDADVDHPAYQAALKFVAEALYRGGAAESIAVQLKKGSDRVGALAEVCYEIMTVAAEKLEGQLPEELYLMLAATILEELSEIAEAAGIEYTDANLAEVLKRNLTRYLAEIGVEPEKVQQLEAAMNQVTPETFDKLASQAGDVKQ